jgi:membrane associated rhomboid family serine protease
MRMIALPGSLRRYRSGGNCLLAHVARVAIALSLVVALFGVHSALARAEGPGAPGIAATVVDVDHQGDPLAMAHAAHLAGHLTGVVAAAVLEVALNDATQARQKLPADALPRSTTLPAPSEPPRA